MLSKVLINFRFLRAHFDYQTYLIYRFLVGISKLITFHAGSSELRCYSRRKLVKIHNFNFLWMSTHAKLRRIWISWLFMLWNQLFHMIFNFETCNCLLQQKWFLSFLYQLLLLFWDWPVSLDLDGADCLRPTNWNNLLYFL